MGRQDGPIITKGDPSQRGSASVLWSEPELMGSEFVSEALPQSNGSLKTIRTSRKAVSVEADFLIEEGEGEAEAQEDGAEMNRAIEEAMRSMGESPEDVEREPSELSFRNEERMNTHRNKGNGDLDTGRGLVSLPDKEGSSSSNRAQIHKWRMYTTG